MSSSTDLTPSDISSLATDYDQYVEILLESREINAGWNSVSQTITLGFQLDPAATPTDPGHEFLGSATDVIALQRAFTLLPLFKILPDSDDNDVILTRNNLRLREKNNYGWWIATCTYEFSVEGGGSGGRGLAETPDPNVVADNVLDTIQLNFGSGSTPTKHITQSFSTNTVAAVGAVGPAAVLPTLNRTIGATKDGIVGVDVPDNSLDIQVTAYYRPSFVNNAFITRFKNLKGKTNTEVFLGQAIGEVLFLDWSGGGTIYDIVPITFTFSIKENQPTYSDGVFPDASVLGHQLIEYMYVEKAQVGPGINIQEPTYRVIHTIHSAASFADFGFGIDP